jgi:7-alpha-hydroxysteroid dehydrogenase
VACDVNDPAQLAAAVTATLSEFGRLTHLVNNAGGAGPNDPLKLSPQRFDEILRFNVGSAYALTQLCVPAMREAGGGNIINITSGAARYAQRHFSAYGAAKAALTQLTRLLAQDFAPQVRVNGIAPGPILTAALDRALPADMREGMVRNTPLQRLGETEDIAAAALYLATGLRLGHGQDPRGGRRRRIQRLAGLNEPPSTEAALHRPQFFMAAPAADRRFRLQPESAI